MLHTKQTHRKKKLSVGLVLLVATAVGLFPYGWLAEQWPWFDRVTQSLFESEPFHLAGHLGLFVLLGVGLLTLRPWLWQQPGYYFAILLLVGVVQELLQLASFKSWAFGLSDLYDLTVDLVGAVIGYGLFWRWNQQSLVEIRRTG